jgi:ribonucleoside-diphosphate reductase alpha chain
MFKPTGFSEIIFKDRYSFTSKETWEEACNRLAKQMALAESPEKQKQYETKFTDILVNNYFVPGGRIWYNSGRNNPQLLNCFVLTNQLDSKEGWGEIAKQMIITSMTGGGCGIDFSDVRPRGAKIGDQKGDCPGPVELMRLIDNCAKPVRAGGQRRVALMFSLDLDHPDIEEFLDAKLTKGELTHANVSVRSKRTKDFIKAVKEDGEWELSWKGKYKKSIKAKPLWERIVKNAYNSAEPGFLNWELVENESNIGYIEKLVTTNPCGEIALSSYDCCCLGHLVLPKFVLNESFNYELLADTIRSGVRFLDNVLTVNNYPLPEMKEKSHKLRRIGMGTTGLADTLALLGLKYGSEEGNKFVDKLYKFIAKVAYETSVMLAVEKGMFPACDPSKHVESDFMKRMPHKIRSLVKEHGIRNCAILTQAPTGTVSILSGNCSSGIEPMFSPAYERRYWQGNERKSELVFHPLFEEFMKQGKDVSHFVGSHELTVQNHMELQAIVQKWVDNAVSKTINMANDYPMEDMEKLWLDYLPKLKGTTFYREGTRGYVDDGGKVLEPPLKPIELEEAKKRFNESYLTGSEQSMECPSGVCEI